METIISLINKFSNRELAISLWFLIVVICMLFNQGIRKAFFRLVKAFFAWKLTVSYLAMLLYTIAILIPLYLIKLWSFNYLPVTFLWLIFTAFVMLFHHSEANDRDFFFKKLKENLKVLIIVEFIVNLYVFNFWIEFALVPFLALLAMLLTVSDTDKKFGIVKKILDKVMAAIGTFLVSYAIYKVVTDFSHFASLENFANFYLPILLSILFLPFVYFSSLISTYEMFFLRLGYFVQDLDVLRYAKIKTIVAFNINLWSLNKWTQHVISSWRFKSKEEVIKALRDFRRAGGPGTGQVNPLL